MLRHLSGGDSHINERLTQSASEIPSGRPTFRNAARRCGSYVCVLDSTFWNVMKELTLPIVNALHMDDNLVGPPGLALCSMHVNAEMMSWA